MTKATLLEDLAEAIRAIENEELYTEVSSRDSFIESIQEMECGLEDGTYLGEYEWDEDALPDNMCELLLDELAEKYIKAQLKVDLILLIQAIMCTKEFIVNLIVFSALYNL